jgi:serine phosphatase RsbU (regulator of sigma subunit)
LLLVRSGELFETKADKFAIAGDQIEESRRFTVHNLGYLPNDMIYMTTDGFADQFGGPKGKKFMVRKLHTFLVAISGLPCAEQKVKLASAFNEWKGAHEQVDDVLVIGIRL